MDDNKIDFLEKAKRLAAKAEDLIEKQIEKLNKSGVVDEISDYIDKSGDFVKEKIADFNKSDIPDKVDDFVEKTEKKAGEVIEQAQVVGDKISKKVEDVIDNIKGKSNAKHKTNDDGRNTPKPI